MGSKKKRPAADPAMSTVREMFQRNLHVTNAVQRRSKSDIITKFDLTEKFYARRIKAVCNLLPEMQKRYAAKYPSINIGQEFADVASMPLISYDIIDKESYLCMGAAIWMLDQIWEAHQIQELCDLLPEDCDDVDMLEVYDTRYSYELMERMLWVIQNRYGKTDRYVVPKNILSKREDSAFHDILALIPKESISMAVDQLKLKFWKWADCYFAALNPLFQKSVKLDETIKRLSKEIDEANSRKAVKNPASLHLPLSSPLPLLDDDLMNSPKMQTEMLMRRLDKLEEENEKIHHQIGDFHFMSIQAAIMGKNRVAECVGEEYADSFYNFPIEDPYEMCFAILYLLDQDDDYAWTYSFMAAVICRAATMLPWGYDRYDEPYDGFWFDDDEWIPPVPMNPEWYETLYTGDAYDDGEEPHDVSIAQIVYQNTGALLPRDMHRFDDAFRPLKKKGLKPSQAGMVCALMDVLGEASRQRQFTPSDPIFDDEDDPEWVNDIMQLMKSNSAKEESNSASAENEKLKKELAQLKEQAKKANYALSRENRELKDKLEKAGQETNEMAQELADLREIVFNQQVGAVEEKQEDTKIKFPYRTTRRLIAFGGHDSFLREIKFKLPDVRFVGEDISGPEIIRRADVVWIQTNCIGHKSYYNIIDLARKYGRKVRYFKYASATKCAEQVVEEEENAGEK